MDLKLNSILLAVSFFIFWSGSPLSIFSERSETPSQTIAKKSPQDIADLEGEKLYMKYCLTCHQKDGSGVPNMFPQIKKSDWVNGDKERLIKLLLNGLKGEIEVNGELFSQVMPQQNYLTDVQIALVLTYIRQNFGNDASAVKPEEVTTIRESK